MVGSGGRDAIRVSNRRKAMRNENRCALSRRGEDAVEDLRLAAHIELRRRFIEKLREKTAHCASRLLAQAFLNSLQEHERVYRLQLAKFQQRRSELRNLRASIPS